MKILNETENVNIKNWKSLIKPGKLDVKISEDLTPKQISSIRNKKISEIIEKRGQ